VRGGYAPGEVEGRVRSDHGNDNRKCDQAVIVGTGEGLSWNEGCQTALSSKGRVQSGLSAQLRLELDGSPEEALPAPDRKMKKKNLYQLSSGRADLDGLSGATGDLAPAFVYSHIWPKAGQIWGTPVRGDETSAELFLVSNLAGDRPQWLP
jgi:hypothetical protein